jgi:hypothetical protein
MYGDVKYVRLKTCGSGTDLKQSDWLDEEDRQQLASDGADYSHSANEGKSSRKRRDVEDESDE